MAEHPGISLTVVHFIASKEIVERMLKVDMTGQSKISSESADKSVLDEIKNVSDDNSIKFQERVVNSARETVEAVREFSRCNLFVVGRMPEGPVAAALNVKAECPELGHVGNLLTSHDFTTSASVLIVQHFNSLKEAKPSSGSSTKIAELHDVDSESG